MIKTSIIKIRRIDNGFIVTTNYKSSSYERYCKDYDELFDWMKSNFKKDKEEED